MGFFVAVTPLEDKIPLLLKCGTIIVLFCGVSSLKNKREKKSSLLCQLHSQIIAKSGNLGFTSGLSREKSVVIRGVLQPTPISQEVTFLLQHLVRFLQSSFFTMYVFFYQLHAPPKPSILLLLILSLPILHFLSAFCMCTQRDSCLRAPVRLTSLLHSRQTAAALMSGCLAGCLPEHGGSKLP